MSAPASVNVTRGEHWTVTRRRKQRATVELVNMLLGAQVPRPIPGDRVHATAVAYYPVNRRRDEGNLRAPLEKALGDALAPARGGMFRWLSDDTPEHFTFGALTFGIRPGPPSVEVKLTWGDSLPCATCDGSGEVDDPDRGPGDCPDCDTQREVTR